jgi:hypothetical protein
MSMNERFSVWTRTNLLKCDHEAAPGFSCAWKAGTARSSLCTTLYQLLSRAIQKRHKIEILFFGKKIRLEKFQPKILTQLFRATVLVGIYGQNIIKYVIMALYCFKMF